MHHVLSKPGSVQRHQEMSRHRLFGGVVSAFEGSHIVTQPIEIGSVVAERLLRQHLHSVVPHRGYILGFFLGYVVHLQRVFCPDQL
jgi:hypothetical protein